MQLEGSWLGQTCSPFLRIGKTWASFQEIEKLQREKGSWKSCASTGLQVLRTIARILSDPIDLEVFSRRRALRTLRLEKLICDIKRDIGGGG